jgi:uncharacterized protein YkwD
VKTPCRMTATLLALVVLLCLPVVASAASPAATSALAKPLVQGIALQPSYAEQMALDLINKQRAKRGLRALRLSDALTAAARAHSAEMGSRKFFSHDSSNGESFASRISRYGYSRSGYRSWAAGEDIYWGSGLYGTAVAAVQAWMRSSSHRAVILKRDFRDVGIGAVDCSSGFGGAKGTVTFYPLDAGRRSR